MVEKKVNLFNQPAKPDPKTDALKQLVGVSQALQTSTGSSGRKFSAIQEQTNLKSPGFSDLSKTSLMYVDYLLSHGAPLPNVITNESLLQEFEKLSALEDYAIEQFSGGAASQPIATIPVFSPLSVQSLRQLDHMLLDGVPLPDEISNASIDTAFNAQATQLTQKSKNIVSYLNEIGHPLPADVTNESLENELYVAKALLERREREAMSIQQ